MQQARAALSIKQLEEAYDDLRAEKYRALLVEAAKEIRYMQDCAKRHNVFMPTSMASEIDAALAREEGKG